MGQHIRPDWEGALHHVMARGIDGRSIFNSTVDRSDMYQRLSQLVAETGTRIYAWVIMPNHLHLLIRTGIKPISTFMHRLLTGYAICYNRREDRKGYVFQGRFKSILVQEDEYFLQLVKYIHLNPLKAGIVNDYDSLERYNWSGHKSLLGVGITPWQDVNYVLSKFNILHSKPKLQYLKFIKEEMSDKETLKLIWGVALSSIRGSNRSPELSDARAMIAWICWKQIGLSKTDCARILNKSRSGASQAIDRGTLLAEDCIVPNELCLLSVASDVRPRERRPREVFDDLVGHHGGHNSNSC